MVCKYFGVCGGCQNQHLSYEQQLQNKKHRLQYLLQLYYKGDIQVHSGSEYGYRNRMDFITARNIVGFRQIDERKLVDIEECPISEQRVNDLLTEVRRWLRQHPELEAFEKQRKAGVMKYAVIRTGENACVSFMLNEDSTKLASHIDCIKAFAEETTAENVVVSYTPADKDDSISLECFPAKGDENLKILFCGKQVWFHTQGFFQNNTAMAEKMVLHVKQLLIPYHTKERSLIDAYGGVGTFGIVLAEDFRDVISIESHPLASEACSRNITANTITNMTAVNEDAGNLRKLDLAPDAIYLLDPPRSGLGDKALRYLLEKKPQIIVYISCNPAQLSKELVQLSQHYTVQRVDLFDLFPQTNHAEVVVLLERIT